MSDLCLILSNWIVQIYLATHTLLIFGPFINYVKLNMCYGCGIVVGIVVNCVVMGISWPTKMMKSVHALMMHAHHIFLFCLTQNVIIPLVKGRRHILWVLLKLRQYIPNRFISFHFVWGRRKLNYSRRLWGQIKFRFPSIHLIIFPKYYEIILCFPFPIFSQ